MNVGVPGKAAVEWVRGQQLGPQGDCVGGGGDDRLQRQ